jgi:hypothetical protein
LEIGKHYSQSVDTSEPMNLRDMDGRLSTVLGKYTVILLNGALDFENKR